MRRRVAPSTAHAGSCASAAFHMVPADVPHARAPPSPPEASARGSRIDRSEAKKGEVGVGDARNGGGKGRRGGALDRRNLLVSALEEDVKESRVGRRRGGGGACALLLAPPAAVLRLLLLAPPAAAALLLLLLLLLAPPAAALLLLASPLDAAPSVGASTKPPVSICCLPWNVLAPYSMP